MSEYSDELQPEASASREPDRALAVRNAIAAIRQRWWLVLGVFAVIVATSIWRTSRETRLYQSSAVIQIDEEQGPVAAQTAPTPGSWRIDPMLSAQEIIKSKEIAERVARDLGLQLVISQPQKIQRSRVFGETTPIVDSSLRFAEFLVRFEDSGYALTQNGATLDSAAYGDSVSGGGIQLAVPERPQIGESEAVLSVIPLTGAAGTVRGGIVTKLRPQTNIIEITYTGPDPFTVQRIANSVAGEYREFSSEDRRTVAEAKTVTIEERLVEQRRRLDSAQQALKRFKEDAQLGNVTAEQTSLIQSINLFEGQRDAVLVERGVYQQLLGSLSAADTTTEDLRRLGGTSAIESNPYIASLYTQWFDLVKRRSELITQERRGTDYIDVEATDSLIAATKTDLQQASGLYLRNLQSRIESFEARITSLRAELTKYPALEASEANLLGDVRTLQRVYDELNSEHQRALIGQSAGATRVRIVDEAGRPSAPISPNRRRAAMTAMILGLLMGLAGAVAVEQLDDSVKSPDEIRDQIGLSVLGTIPGIKASGSRADTREGHRLVTHIDPRSPVAEAYRSLRTNLAFARAHEALRTIVLTSPGPADGKSTTVANLAITFAQQGQRTLLIDADLRRAVLDKLFEVPREPGLTDVLVGKASLAQSVSATAIPNLSVLGSGPFPPNPSELLGSARMRDTLREAKENFDVILLDSPPLLAVTDAAVLSTLVDGAILVIRIGSTARTAVRRAIGQLHTVHGRVVGSVLNDVDFRSGAYGGQYGYYYYYYYGQDGHRNGRGVLDRVRRLTGLGAAGRGRS